MSFSLTTQIAEVQREIEMRKRVYPRQIGRGAMRRAEAEYRIAAMTAVLESLLQLAQLDTPTANPAPQGGESVEGSA